MSSDRPTDPAPKRGSFRPSPSQLAQLYSLAKWAVSTGAAVVTALLSASAWVENHVTQQELEERLKPVDANAAALLDRLAAETGERRALGAELEAQRKELDRTRLDLQWSWWWFTGIRQAELEHSKDPRKVQRAAEAARDRFDAYVRQGMTFEEAHRRAVRRGLP